jgi:hypothetical protein
MRLPFEIMKSSLVVVVEEEEEEEEKQYTCWIEDYDSTCFEGDISYTTFTILSSIE